MIDAADLAELRALAEAVLVDVVRIERREPAVYDRQAGSMVTPEDGITIIYTGPGLVGERRTRWEDRGQVLAVHGPRALVPASVTSAQAGDIIVVETSEDPMLAGTEWLIGEVPSRTLRVLRHLPVERLTPGAQA